MESLDKNYWASRYQNKDIGWDAGQITTPLKNYFDQLENKDLRILIPGAGNGHEAAYLHQQGFTQVFVLDIAQEPLDQFKQNCPDFPTEHQICADFFAFQAEKPFDLIVEQTFFCALNVQFRALYARKCASLLNENGKIVGLLFNFPFETTQGPPFGGDLQEYQGRFLPYFTLKTMGACFNSIKPRAGKELFFIANKKNADQVGQENFRTQAIRTQDRSEKREHASPIFMTSSFVFDSAEHAQALFDGTQQGTIYSRYSNPSTDEFIKKMCLLEGAQDGIATATGMSAMFLSMAAFLQAGDHVLASQSLFGSTIQILTEIFPRWGISHTFVPIDQPHLWEQNIRPNTKMIFAETPSNPGLDLLDIAFLADLAKAHNLLLNIDNCFATPYLQNPLKLGADIVTHSATKFIDGQGRVLGGAVLASEALIEKARFMARHTGPALSPFNAWVLSKSLETLAVRMQAHCEQALSVAYFLEGHQKVQAVRYPFLPSHPAFDLAKKQMKMGGGLVSLEVKGGKSAAVKFLNALQMISLSSNLGDTRSIATHPATTTHSKLTPQARQQVGISDGLVRISVGLESLEDLLKDIDQALNTL